jgi:hypothetical protein
MEMEVLSFQSESGPLSRQNIPNDESNSFFMFSCCCVYAYCECNMRGRAFLGFSVTIIISSQ